MQEEIWLEKYRPQTLEEVYGNQDIINQLRYISQEGNLPNMLLNGPPGIGKTSSIECLARELLQDNMKNGYLELNASDERGIDVIREKVKSFAQKKVKLQKGLHKIVVLDEADSLTEGAQQALRMIISDYADSTRFMLSCNDSSKIIDAIQSRCAILRFSILSDLEVLRRIQQIIDKENIPFEDDGLEALIFTAEGDMRKAINNLQATYQGCGKISKEAIFQVCDVPNIDELTAILNLCIEGKFELSLQKMHAVWTSGHTAYDLVNNMAKLLQNNNVIEIDIDLQYQLLNEMTTLKQRLLEGLPTFLQIAGFLAKMTEISINYYKQNNKK